MRNYFGNLLCLVMFSKGCISLIKLPSSSSRRINRRRSLSYGELSVSMSFSTGASFKNGNSRKIFWVCGYRTSLIKHDQKLATTIHAATEFQDVLQGRTTFAAKFDVGIGH